MRTVILIVLIAVASCTSRLESRTSDLVNAKNLWVQTNAGRTYSFDVVRHCYCTFNGVRVRVTVVDDKIVRTTHSQDTIFTGEPNPYGYQTIPGYFNLILDLIERELNSGLALEVEYDEQSGFPSRIAWSEPSVTDSAVQIEISDYAPK